MKLFSMLSNALAGGQARRDSRAKTLPPGLVDLLDLYDRGLVSVTGVGCSITELTMEITSLVSIPLDVIVGCGTYLVSKGQHQNMAVRRRKRLTLQPRKRETIRLQMACINASRPIPNEKNRFRGVARVPEPVRRFMEAAENEHAMVVQAGVWALTDGFSGEAVQRCLRTRVVTVRNGRPVPGSDMRDEGPAVTRLHIERARYLLDRLQIPHAL